MKNVIVGINGKIGSGKDTVGSIIQYLTNKYKYDSFESFLKSSSSEESKVFKIKKFAGKLKEVASLITGIPVEKFEDQEFKKTYLGSQWDKVYSISPSLPEERVKMTVREFLQILGTEAVRDSLHYNAWVNALFAEYDNIVPENWDENGNTTVAKFLKWVITDMRFPNEFEAVKQRGGFTIRVLRPCIICGLTKYQMRGIYCNDIACPNQFKPHPSETALDNFTFDYEIENSGTIEDLVIKVKDILTIENIL